MRTQDAGLYTYQRTLDIRFVDEEVRNAKEGKIWGSSFTLKRKERYASYKDVRAGDSNPDLTKLVAGNSDEDLTKLARVGEKIGQV